MNSTDLGDLNLGRLSEQIFINELVSVIGHRDVMTPSISRRLESKIMV